MTKRKILIATLMLDRQGPDRVLLELMKGLPRERFSISLAVARTDGAYMDQVPKDVPVFEVEGGRYPVRDLLAVVRRVRPDILFTSQHMSFGATLTRLFFPPNTIHVTRIATILSSHFEDVKRRGRAKAWLAKTLTQLGLREADLVICQSQGMAQDAVKLGAREDKIAIINNPIDIVVLDKMRADPHAPVLPGRPRILAAGRLVRLKGYDILIEAMAQVTKSHPTAELTILGDGEDRAALLGLAERLSLKSHVHLPGKTQNPYAQMAQADLFVCSSYYEGFSNVLIEAMACGTPVVATDCCGGNAEIVSGQGAGWLTKPGDSSAMAATLVEALKSDLKRAGELARISCASRFASSAIIGKYADALDAAYEKSGRRAAEPRSHLIKV